MFSIVRQQHPATGVEHSLYCNFFSLLEKNLIVVAANNLRVFRLSPSEAVSSERVEDYMNDPQDALPPSMRLECVANWTLHAPIQSISKVSLVGSFRDLLLLSFLDAKLSVVEYNPEEHNLRTVSLHMYEDEDIKNGIQQNIKLPHVCADPDGRCAAFLAYGRSIVILPFKLDPTADDLAAMDSLKIVRPIEEASDVARAYRAPVLPSYKLDLFSVIRAQVSNIIDVQFLYGYNQPTIMILYEPLKAFAGRLAVRKDTCRLNVITLDVKDRISASVWSREVLPFDAFRIVPVPSPIGGALILTVNSLFYINQGTPYFAVGLNSIKDFSTDMTQIEPLLNVCIALDGCCMESVGPGRFLFCLKDGSLHVLSLQCDNMRTVRGFHISRPISAILTTTICACEDNFIFLGSRLANSLLVRLRENIKASTNGASSRLDRILGPKYPRIQSDDSSTTGPKEIMDIEDTDLEVYGQENATDSMGINIFSVVVCDTLSNIGPCAQVSMGEPSFLSEEFSAHFSADPLIQLVVLSGHGKNGALSIMQRTIQPQVVTTFELQGILDMWTLIGDDTDVTNGHAFLVLTRSSSTLVLRAGKEISEIDQSGFYTKGPTIFVSNIGDCKFIVQVYRKGVRLLTGSEQMQEIRMEPDTFVASASISDSYLVLLTEEGQMILLTLNMSLQMGGTPHLTLTRCNHRHISPLILISAFKDTSGLFTRESKKVQPSDCRHQQTSRSETATSWASYFKSKSGNRQPSRTIDDFDDEELDLYGESNSVYTSAAPTTLGSCSLGAESSPPFWAKWAHKVQPTYWVVGLRENGQLEIFSLPEFRLSFVTKDFPLGSMILKDNLSKFSTTSSKTGGVPVPPSCERVTELMLVSLGDKYSPRPLLIARTEDHELLIYEAFSYDDGQQVDSGLKIRFKRITHGLVLRQRMSNSKEQSSLPFNSRLRFFRDISGYEGVFLCGPYPHWLMMTGRGELRCHSMPSDGAISMFAAFHNVNCPNGFLYFNHKNELRICVLSTQLSYDCAWPTRKVPFRRTMLFVDYHIESKTYAIVTAVTQPCHQIWKFNGDDKELCDMERPDRFAWPTTQSVSIELFSPVTWESIPGSKMHFEEWERCTQAKHLYLASEGVHTGLRGYIVCSSSFVYGEDVTPRGFIRIFDVIEVIPELDQPLTKNKMKLVYGEEQKGPISAIAAVSGNLVAAVGQKIYVFQFKNKQLFGVAFVDSLVYINHLVTLKNFILAGDCVKSIDLLLYQPDYRTLSVISHDSSHIQVESCAFVVDNSHLSFLVTDAAKNIRLFAYQPLVKESFGGQRLIQIADFHLGQTVQSTFRIRARLTDPSCSSKILTGWEKRNVNWFVTLDGAVGYLLPCSEKTYRRLSMLQNVLLNAIPHTAGLNPRASRTIVRGKWRELKNPCRGIIDGDLIFKFVDLSIPEKIEISRKIGTNYTELMDNLAQLDRMAAHF